MTRLTITEALAEVKTIVKRLEKKQVFVLSHLGRQSVITDPFLAEGGAPAKVDRELQAMLDLRSRSVNLRIAIQHANLNTMLTILGVTQSVAAWLVWRKEQAGGVQKLLGAMLSGVEGIQNQARTRGGRVSAAELETPATMVDWTLHINISAITAAAERIEETLGVLDGKLSMLNATTFVEVE